MLIGAEIGGGERLALIQLREALFGVIGNLAAVGKRRNLNVGLQEPGEADGAPGGGEFHLVLLRRPGDGDLHGGTAGVGHLRGHGALPNQLIELKFLGIQGAGELPRSGKGLACRTNRLVSLLGVFHLPRVLPGRVRDILGAVEFQRLLASGIDTRLGQRGRVGTHVGNVTVFVEPLRHAHGALRSKVQLTPGLLLQRRGHKRRVRPTRVGLLLHRRHGQLGADQVAGQCLRHLLIDDRYLVGFLQLTAVIKIAPLGHARSVDSGEGGTKGSRLIAIRARLAGVKGGADVPVFGRDKAHPLAFALYDHAGGHRLDTPGRQARHYLLPQHWGDLVAIKTIEDTPPFLRVHEVLVQLASVRGGLQNSLLGNLVEDHAAHRHLRIEYLQQMPSDGFALTVGVSCQVELVYLLELGLKIGDLLLFVSTDHVQRGEALIDVDTQASPRLLFVLGGHIGGAAGEVADVPDGSLHNVIIAKIGLDFTSLRCRLDNYQPLEAI